MIKNYVKNDKETVQVIIIFRFRFAQRDGILKGSFPEARNWSIKGSNKQNVFIVTFEIVRSTSLFASFLRK